MEEILASIKKIIAADGDDAGREPKPRRRPPAPAARDDILPEDIFPDTADDDILELTDTFEAEAPAEVEARVEAETPAEAAAPADPVEPPEARPETVPEPIEAILSDEAATASRKAFAALSAMTERPAAPADPDAGAHALENLVREMLRPMLKQWLDANLPGIVEAMVAREIARITAERS